MIPNTSVPRALRASVQSTELLQKQKCGETLNANADSVLRNNFAGGRIRKTETTVFEIRRDSGFRPAGGCGRNAGRILFIFLRAWKKEKLA